MEGPNSSFPFSFFIFFCHSPFFSLTVVFGFSHFVMLIIWSINFFLSLFCVFLFFLGSVRWILSVCRPSSNYLNSCLVFVPLLSSLPAHFKSICVMDHWVFSVHLNHHKVAATGWPNTGFMVEIQNSMFPFTYLYKFECIAWETLLWYGKIWKENHSAFYARSVHSERGNRILETLTDTYVTLN